MSMDRLFFDLCLLVIYDKLAPTNSTKVYQFTRTPMWGSMQLVSTVRVDCVRCG